MHIRCKRHKEEILLMSRNIFTSKPGISDAEKALRSTSAGKLIFTVQRNHMCALLIQDERLKAARVLDNITGKIGAVYIGKVKNVVKNIDACFVEIANGELCFLPMKATSQAVLLNRNTDGRILEGDEFLVQVIRDAQKTKQASVTTKLNVTGKEFEQLLETAKHRTCFSCLVKPPEAFVAVLEQMVYDDEYEEILTDDEVMFKKLQEYCEQNLPEKKVRFYEDKNFSLSKLYSLETKLDTALNTRIWLKSGGYLVIEPTEALTVIDVNSGKIDVRKSNQETIYKVNREAATEIALQLRLRNLSGIIIVDFINMESKEHRVALLEQLRDEVKEDTHKTVIVDMTALGLVEITRKKSYKPLQEQFR